MTTSRQRPKAATLKEILFGQIESGSAGLEPAPPIKCDCQRCSTLEVYTPAESEKASFRVDTLRDVPTRHVSNGCVNVTSTSTLTSPPPALVDEQRLRAFASTYLERLHLGGAVDDDELRASHFWLNDFFRQAYDYGLLQHSIEPALPTAERSEGSG